VTKIRRLSNRLCGSRDEERFVETLLVLAIYKLEQQNETTILATHDQIRQIAPARFGEAMRRWDNQEVERLKRKYVGRPGSPAKRFELLKELRKGQHSRNGNPGTPSEYAATGTIASLRFRSGAGTTFRSQEEDRQRIPAQALA
jgi:hypothetical protein